MLNLIIWIMTLSLTTCSNQVNEKSGTDEIVDRSSSVPSQNMANRLIEKTELAEIYARAIAEYIGGVYQKDKAGFDTLFLGKRPDFPEMDLPTTISGTKIRLLEQEEINANKLIYSKSSPYVNLIGFVGGEEAEFIFVTFYPELNHQYDCYVNFRYNSEKKDFDLDDLRIEMLVRNKEGKAQHYAIYKDGKYVGNKSIEESKE